MGKIAGPKKRIVPPDGSGGRSDWTELVWEAYPCPYSLESVFFLSLGPGLGLGRLVSSTVIFVFFTFPSCLFPTQPNTDRVRTTCELKPRPQKYLTAKFQQKLQPTSTSTQHKTNRIIVTGHDAKRRFDCYPKTIFNCEILEKFANSSIRSTFCHISILPNNSQSASAVCRSSEPGP